MEAFCSDQEEADTKIALHVRLAILLMVSQAPSSLGQSHASDTSGAWPYRVLNLCMWAPWVCV